MSAKESAVLPVEDQKSLQLERTRKQLDHYAWLMDNCFRIPGIGWRFGLEAILGIFPGAGDVIGGAMGVVLLVRAFQFKLPKIVIFRMILNTLIDVTVGAIPLLGDLFDFVWKSNTKNMKLFHKYAGEPETSTRKHWIFVGILIGSFLLLFFVIVLLTVLLIVRFYSHT
jgi:hypothetical protein